MYYFNARIQAHVHVAEGWHVLSFFMPSEYPVPAAGQFLSLALEHCAFRKPFAISDYEKETGLCSILYEVRGKGTRKMSEMRSGDTINVMGIHGNAFALPSKRALLVAGGIGLGPLLYFEKKLSEQNISSTLYAGFKTKALIPNTLIRNTVSQSCHKTVLCTDDGSTGLHGTVLDALSRTQDSELQEATLYLCGPLGMLKAGVAYAQQIGLRAFVSLETMMACATGACMGCVVPVHTQGDNHTNCYKRVCVDGPIFNAEDVLWQNMHKTQ